MPNPIGLINLITILATLMSVIFLAIGWRRTPSRDVNFLFLGLLSFNLLYHTDLALEWFGIDTTMESFEDIAGAMVAMWWWLVLYGLFKEVLDDESRKSEDALRKSEEFLNTIIENIPDMIFVKDAENLRFVRFNVSGEQLLGYSREELIGKNDYDLFPREQADYFTAKDREVLRHGGLHEIPEEVVQTRHQKKRILKTIKIAMQDKSGRAEYLLGISEDITQKIQSAREVEQWGRIFEHAGWGVALVSADGRKLEAMNPAFAKMHGYEVDELKQGLVKNLIAPDHLERFRSETDLAANRKKHSLESVSIRKDGTTFPVQVDVTFMQDQRGDPNYWVVNVQDITDKKFAEEKRKQLEIKLSQAQKMESIGTLAGGIAHDFNNILGAIFGYTEMSMLDLDKSNTKYKNLKNVIKAADRARDLVRQILTFSRQAEINISPIQVGPIVEETVKFLRSSIPTSIEIHQEIPPVKEMVMADPTQIQQVIMNLCTNAAHAMKEKGGVLDIRMTDIFLESYQAGTTLPAGHYLLLTVADNGHGMDSETLARIFEPYFTTKDKDEGTGLGLAVVHGIVTSHGGDIIVHSGPGQGTTFNIYLPLIEQVIANENDEKKTLPTGTEKIMFIDDEEALTEICRHHLEHLGYHVETYTDSRAALENVRSRTMEYDLIITDHTMPGMNGIDLAREVLKLRPDLPIILCSGSIRSISALEISNIGFTYSLMKPLRLDELAVAVRSALDKKGFEQAAR